MNVKFHYLYRDGANYKQYGCHVFSNKLGYSVEEVDNSIRSALIDETWFYAHKWQLNDLHLHKWDEEIDHSWHEYDCVEISDDIATLGDISDFIALILCEREIL